MMFWYDGGHWAWWEAGVMWIAMIAFWAIVIWLGYTVISGLLRDGRHRGGEQRPEPGPRDTAGDILDERLARGEIDVEEYRRLRQEIDERRSTRAGAPG